MPPVETIFCTRVALSVGFVSGVGNTLFQAYVPQRYQCNTNSRQVGWNIGAALLYFAAGTVVGTVGAGPLLILIKRTSTRDVLHSVVMTSASFSPVYLALYCSTVRRNISDHTPIYLSAGTGIASVIASMASTDSNGILGKTKADASGLGSWVTVALGFLLFLNVQFTNRLAYIELHLLYKSVVPRFRADPEVNWCVSRTRFCQAWGNLTSLCIFYKIMHFHSGKPNGGLISTILPDLVMCNILFVGLFHHMQACDCGDEERTMHRISWAVFIPTSFLNTGYTYFPMAFAAIFISTYDAYWRQVTPPPENMADNETVVIPELPPPAGRVPPAHPATPAHPTEPSQPAVRTQASPMSVTEKEMEELCQIIDQTSPRRLGY